LGAALLSALEKRDAEALSLLRSGQELRLMEVVREVRVKQIDEAKANIEALQESREMAQTRKDYYEGQDFINVYEGLALLLSATAQLQLGAKAAADAISIPLSLLPDAKTGSPTTSALQLAEVKEVPAARLIAVF
jgi:hypothetical protein